mgnify:CR=1 FL=1
MNGLWYALIYYGFYLFVGLAMVATVVALVTVVVVPWLRRASRVGTGSGGEAGADGREEHLAGSGGRGRERDRDVPARRAGRDGQAG